jgi:hypothetical protein
LLAIDSAFSRYRQFGFVLGRRRGTGAPLKVLLAQRLLTLGRKSPVNGLIYLIGLLVVILFILSFLGLR